MAAGSSDLTVGYADTEINELLADPPDAGASYTRHYNQTEEFFLRLDTPYQVPSFPIHHDVRVPQPTDEYIEALRTLIRDVAPLAPAVFSGLTHVFDPTDTLHPSFFKLFKVEDSHYLYLLKLDLMFRVQDHEIVERSTNDRTACYRTSTLYAESVFVPLREVGVDNGRISRFGIRQTVSQTWIGEQGRGYFRQGIWMDQDLTKFFSKLFLPQGKRVYPFSPYTCRYKTVCQTVIDHSPERRKVTLPHLHQAIEFLVPRMAAIQEALKNTPFSDNLPEFMQIRKEIPPAMTRAWQDLTVERYLNDDEQREFRIATE